VPPTIPFNYDGAEAQRVKQLYRSVFQVLARFVLFGEFKKKPSPDLWDADTPLQGPKQFAGIRWIQSGQPVHRSWVGDPVSGLRDPAEESQSHVFNTLQPSFESKKTAIFPWIEYNSVDILNAAD
jgi:hypothetical protein